MLGEKGSAPVDWRANLPNPLIIAIEEAIARFRANDDYELRSSKLADTIDHLNALASQSEALILLIGSLSPVAMAAIHEEGLKRRITAGRYELQDVASALKDMPYIARSAAIELHEMHSPLPDEGQGSGSAMGRDSDLRAIEADHEQKPGFHFRSPKDKLAVAVIKAYLRYQRQFDVNKRGAASALGALLHALWADIRPGEVTNWKRVTHSRFEIAHLVEQEIAAEALWIGSGENGNATSAETQRSPT